MLADSLMELKDDGILTAKHVCALAFWSFFAGAVGDVNKIKL